ncbi:hypothetical protein ADL27_21840, partial [Streptomyces sp. NRRL F-6602]
MARPYRIHTLGHSTREFDEVVRMLRAHDVTLLADVRRALPPGVPDPTTDRRPGVDGAAPPLDRDAVLSAYLDLVCLRT